MVERFNPLVVLASIHKERCTALYGLSLIHIYLKTNEQVILNTWYGGEMKKGMIIRIGAMLATVTEPPFGS